VSDDVDRLLACIRGQLGLDAESEYKVLEEIRDHLEDAAADAQARGLGRDEALAEAVARFGMGDIGQELHEIHEGEATADGIIAAGLPVICALILRWLVFSPDGTAVHWKELLTRPVFWVVAFAALLIPALKFSRRRYALASWTFFWVISVIFVIGPALRW